MTRRAWTLSIDWNETLTQIMKRVRTLSSAFAVVSIVVLLTACASADLMSSGSRVKLYTSLKGLAADSSLVAQIAITDQDEHVATDSSSAYTSSVATIEATFRPTGLPASSSLDTAYGPGSEIVVRQLTLKGTVAEGGGPALVNGGKYLVFLVPSGVPSAGINEFYITGGTAGLFTVMDEGRTFAWRGSEGDSLPAELAIGDLK
jgi:hypothetical protein